MAEQTTFETYLGQQQEQGWAEAVARVIPRIHEVDRDATQIWFAFWPLKLSIALAQSKDLGRTVKDFQLDGRVKLGDQINTSIEFFFGARYWNLVKKEVLDYSESTLEPEVTSLENHILELSRNVAVKLKMDPGFLIGISTVALMLLRQVGSVSLSKSVKESFLITEPGSTREQLKLLKSKRRLKKTLWWRSKKYRVTFDESQPSAYYEALEGQDLSMASSSDQRNFQKLDHRCVAGPVPAQCRSGACGYCWIGILAGRENLSEITEFEKDRLAYFGYASREQKLESHPPVRLACQSKCHGKISIVVPPWNGVLQTRAIVAAGNSRG
mgnify:CR=1 FL=1